MEKRGIGIILAGMPKSKAIAVSREEVNTMNDQQMNGLIPDIKGFCHRYPVRELAVFGSALRDDFNNSSDIDLLVEFEPDAQVGFLTLSKMQRELSEIFHRQVDLVPKEGLKPKIRRAVLSSVRVLYAA